MRTQAFLEVAALVWFVGLVPGGCAGGQAPTITPDSGGTEPKTDTATDTATEQPDLNFACTVDATTLGAWPATGMELPPEVRANFQLWTAMDGAEVPAQLQAQCDNPPPGGDYSPVKADGAGGVSRADVVVATTDVPLYRSYSAERFECDGGSPAQEFGSWWSLTPPELPKQGYRESAAICPAWNDLSMIVTCTLAAGTVVLVGPTQSATCAGTSSCEPAPEGWSEPMPATTTAQLYISTYANGERRSEAELESFLLDCQTQVWPDP